MTLSKVLARWFWYYLMTTTVLVTATSLVVFFYSTFASKPFLNTLFWAFLIEGLILTAAGFATGLSTSEYAYVKQGAINPPAMHAGMEHFRRGRDPKGWGTLLGLVGLTLLFVAFYISSQTSIL